MPQHQAHPPHRQLAHVGGGLPSVSPSGSGFASGSGSGSGSGLAFGVASEERVGNDYVLGKEIGKGSFAVVRKGYRVRPHRTAVAIKVVTRSKLTPKLLENLEGEIAILRAISHPNIVELSDCIKSDAHIYLIMAFAAWGDLSMYIRSGGKLPGTSADDPIWSSRDLGASVVRQQQQQQLTSPSSSGYGLPSNGGLSPAAALASLWDDVRQFQHPSDGGLNDLVVRSFLFQLSSALEFMRGKAIVHRDIKPQNLLLQPADARPLLSTGHPRGIPQVKVADFGFARHLPSASLAETLCGSPLYMAPEILRYERYDAKADLWSVGAVVYEMCVGKPPFRAANHVELLARIDKGEDRIRFPDERSEGSLAREDTRRRQEGLASLLRPHRVPEDVKALIRSLLRRKAVERASFDDLFCSDVVASGSGPALARAIRAQQQQQRDVKSDDAGKNLSGAVKSETDMYTNTHTDKATAAQAAGPPTPAAATATQQTAVTAAPTHPRYMKDQVRTPQLIAGGDTVTAAGASSYSHSQQQQQQDRQSEATTSARAAGSPLAVGASAPPPPPVFTPAPPGGFDLTQTQTPTTPRPAAAAQTHMPLPLPHTPAAGTTGAETAAAPARPTWGFAPKYIVAAPLVATAAQAPAPPRSGSAAPAPALTASAALQQERMHNPRSAPANVTLPAVSPSRRSTSASTSTSISLPPAPASAPVPVAVAINVPRGAFDRRTPSSSSAAPAGAAAGGSSFHAQQHQQQRSPHPRQTALPTGESPSPSAGPGPTSSPVAMNYSPSSAMNTPRIRSTRQAPSLEGGISVRGGGAGEEEPSSLEDNTVATPGSSNIHLLVGVAGLDDGVPSSGSRRGSAAGGGTGAAGSGGSGSGSASGSLLGGEYAIVEKRNVEINALADELGLATSPLQKFTAPLHRRPSRLSKLSGATVSAAAAGLTAAGGSLGRSSALALGLAPITAREPTDFSSTSREEPPQQQHNCGSGGGTSTPGSDSSPSPYSHPWPIPSAPFAIPPGQRPASFNRRASLSSSGSPSPRLRNQSLPQSSAPSPGSLALRAPIGMPSGQEDSNAAGVVGGGSASGSGSPGNDAALAGPSSLSASPTPSPYRAPPGTWTGYIGPTVGSATSSALSRAISMASVRLFGVPSGMTLRNAASLVRSRSFRRLATGSPRIGSDHGSGSVPDAAEMRLLNQLEDLGQKSFVLAEFADSKLAQHFPTGPHQLNAPTEHDPAAAFVGSLGRADGIRSARSSLRMNRRTSSSSVHSGSSPGAESPSPTSVAETAAAEALVLYAKSLTYLQRGIDMTREFLDARTQNGWRNSPSLEINETVQWLRARFNETYEKADFARARCGEMPPSAQFIDKLIFDKALEIARAAAVDELENNREGVAWDSARCLLAYETASSMLLALLDPGEEGMSLSQNSIATIEKFSRSISKRLKALQDRIDPSSSV
ncbi:hypothetical protein K437DRAFT_178779 [Tilletiaria anomala UBC 951]|uniref:non-specific serine/threonine protein kinase n=1 Tax=Tilletiaria anomala (strain ATCC 24038 / CBS 436.72 / UBC 951) TaxID=1037660 RepID=A0A066VR06_TILAU|nr:uncharacterized protein K437DRAFT_178779 [Tilletiaria anomala UBC 951]KDN41229.1 hypothetical protein K437DRAFT_178779 [Tilletiaria anomala UBC 951]